LIKNPKTSPVRDQLVRNLIRLSGDLRTLKKELRAIVATNPENPGAELDVVDFSEELRAPLSREKSS